MELAGSSGLTPPTCSPSLYMLQWHEHHSSFFRLMEELCQSQTMTDVTVVCGDVSLEAHSLILGASSPLLRSILSKDHGRRQTIHFMDMSPFHMQLLLQYMYRGEISVPQAELAPLMQSAKALQIKGLSGGHSDDKISEIASFLQHQQHLQQPQPQPQPHLVLPQAASTLLPSLPKHHFPTVPLPVSANPMMTMAAAAAAVSKCRMPSSLMEEPLASGQQKVAKKRKLRVSGDAELCGDPKTGHVSRINHLSEKPVSMSHEADASMSTTSQAVKPVHKRTTKKKVTAVSSDQPQIKCEPALADVSSAGNNGIPAGLVDEEAGNQDSQEPFPSGSLSENWSDQQKLKVKGYEIPILPKPLTQMKTTETRSYLSRLIWATNGWKRPQYGNPETKPVWWPDELLKWSEMKKMGGKKADGLSNVNYNEIQKNILSEGYRYFGYDPETLRICRDSATETTKVSVTADANTSPSCSLQSEQTAAPLSLSDAASADQRVFTDHTYPLAQCLFILGYAGPYPNVRSCTYDISYPN